MRITTYSLKLNVVEDAENKSVIDVSYQKYIYIHEMLDENHHYTFSKKSDFYGIPRLLYCILCFVLL